MTSRQPGLDSGTLPAVAAAKHQDERPGELPLNGAGGTFRIWVGSIGLLFCLWFIVTGMMDKRGDFGIMGALAALFISPLPGAVLLSGVGVRCGWCPDRLFRALPLIVLGIFLALACCGLVL